MCNEYFLIHSFQNFKLSKIKIFRELDNLVPTIVGLLEAKAEIRSFLKGFSFIYKTLLYSLPPLLEY